MSHMLTYHKYAIMEGVQLSSMKTHYYMDNVMDLLTVLRALFTWFTSLCARTSVLEWVARSSTTDFVT